MVKLRNSMPEEGTKLAAAYITREIENDTKIILVLFSYPVDKKIIAKLYQ